MRLEIRCPHLEIDSELRAYVERKLLFALGRYRMLIRRVTVLVADLNGPRGGIDKRCRIVVRLIRSGEVFVEDVDSDLGVVMDRAVDRVGLSVSRELERRRERNGHLSR